MKLKNIVDAFKKIKDLDQLPLFPINPAIWFPDLWLNIMKNNFGITDYSDAKIWGPKISIKPIIFKKGINFYSQLPF